MQNRHRLTVTDFDLQDFNTVKMFHGDSALMNKSAESDAFFDKIQKSKNVSADLIGIPSKFLRSRWYCCCRH
jgi:hypothetical protein